MIKIYILLLTIILFCYKIEAQKIEKSILKNECMFSIHKVYQEYFMGNMHKNYQAFLKRKCKSNKSELSYTWLYSHYYFPQMHYPYCWDIYNDHVYPITARDGAGDNFGIFKLNIIKKDSTTFLREQKEFHDSLKQLYKTEEAYKKFIYNVLWEKERKKSNSRSIPVIYKYIAMLQGEYNDYSIKPGMICYDFCVLDSVTMEFYVRGIKQFTRWLYHYPPSYKDPSKPENWEELITYSADTLGSYPYLEENMWILHWPDSIRDDPRAQKKFKELYKTPEEPYTDKEYVPSGHHHRYQAIEDSLFFEGHFKVIPQGDERFVINTRHGAIYWLGSQAIHKIGQIQMAQYRSLNNKEYYIEDMDNKRIILFAPVQWQANSHPKPRFKIINKEKMENKFEKLLE